MDIYGLNRSLFLRVDSEDSDQHRRIQRLVWVIMIAGSIGRLLIRYDLKRDGNQRQSETKPDLNRERKRQSFKSNWCKHQ